jgi:hypothetical protein
MRGQLHKNGKKIIVIKDPPAIEDVDIVESLTVLP